LSYCSYKLNLCKNSLNVVSEIISNEKLQEQNNIKAVNLAQNIHNRIERNSYFDALSANSLLESLVTEINGLLRSVYEVLDGRKSKKRDDLRDISDTISDKTGNYEMNRFLILIIGLPAIVCATMYMIWGNNFIGLNIGITVATVIAGFIFDYVIREKTSFDLHRKIKLKSKHPEFQRIKREIQTIDQHIDRIKSMPNLIR